MAATISLSERLNRFRQQADCHFVEREEFCRLLVGSRRLVRADEPSLELRGLMDAENGTRFFIEQQKLAASSR